MKTMTTAFLCLVTVFALPAQAATFCVNQNDTSGNCSTTIGAAVTLAMNDTLDTGEVHTIKIKAATYFESVIIPNDTDLAGLIIKGSGKTIIDPAATDNPALTIDAPDVTVTGLTINNANDDAILVNGTADRFVLTKVSINNATGACANLTGGVDDAVLTGNKLQVCGAILVTGNGADVMKNKFTRAVGGGISIIGTDAVVESNSCANTPVCALVSGANAQIRKNKVVLAASGGFLVSSNDVVFENNSVVDAITGALISGARPQVLGNKFKGGETAMNVTCTADCMGALVERNKIDNYSFSCITATIGAVGGVAPPRFERNTLKGCGTGLVVTSNFPVSQDSNKVVDARTAGIGAGGMGAQTINKNSVTFTGGHGFRIEGIGGNTVAHALTNNKSTKNDQDGFNLDANTNGVTMTGNTATSNIQEGIDTRGGALTANVFSENKASKNRESSDFCNSGTATVNANNNFDSETTTCEFD